jgi:ligand-binding SRPBCC domain-containing protein
MPRNYRLERTQTIPKPKSEVFAFFADPFNLERITPSFLSFRILTPGPIAMEPGTIIDYELRLYGVRMRWQTRIETVEPGFSFTDVQAKGPYRRWHHRHEFAEVPGGTEIRDIVDYQLPFGPLGAIAHALFVRRSLARIFDYRQEAVVSIFSD